MLALLSAKEVTLDLSRLKSTLEPPIGATLGPETTKVLGKRKRDESWRKEIIQSLQLGIFSQETTWIPDDHLNDGTWISQVLDSILVKVTEYV